MKYKEFADEICSTHYKIFNTTIFKNQSIELTKAQFEQAMKEFFFEKFPDAGNEELKIHHRRY